MRMLEVATSLAPEISNVHVGIDNDSARCVGAEQNAIGHLLHLRVEIFSLRWRRRDLTLLHKVKIRPGIAAKRELRASGPNFLRINFVAFVDHFEQFAEYANRFRWAEQQIAARVQGVMKKRQATFLQLRSQIDEDVAATDQVDA